MSASTGTGNTAPAHPCARGIWAILPFINVRGFDVTTTTPRKENTHA